MLEPFMEARRRSQSRDWAGVLEALDPIASDESNHLELAYLLGLAHAGLQHWDEALLYLEEVVTASDELLKVCQCRLALAYVYAVTGRSRLAEYEFEKLIASGFESAQAYSGLGYSAWSQGRMEEAARWYSKALELDPPNANALNGLGYVLAESGRDGARALSCCRKAVDSSPDNPAYLDSLAWAYYKLGYFAEAREAIARALSLAPGESLILEHARALALAAEDSAPEGDSGFREAGFKGGRP